MGEHELLPTFDETDRAIFSIEDARERADRLQADLVPKLQSLYEAAVGLISEIYGEDAIDHSHIASSPSHRKSAKKTRKYGSASYGIRSRRRVGDTIYGAHYFMLSFQASKSGLWPMIEANRPHEASRLVEILQRHENRIVDLLTRIDSYLWWDNTSGDIDDIRAAVRSIRIAEEEQWSETRVTCRYLPYPVIDQDFLWGSIVEFAGLFAIYQAVGDLFAEVEDRFDDYYHKFVDWDRAAGGPVAPQIESTEASPANDGLNPDPAQSEPLWYPEEVVSASEGGLREVLHKDRHRAGP